MTGLLPADWLDELAVFPLPRVVFFPGTSLPLRIFEPRYQAMMKDCIAKGRMAMAVTLLKPGFEADYEGRPEMHDVCTLGRIERYQELPDNHYDLVLCGLTRVRLAELPEQGLPYRRARAEVLDGKQRSEAVTRDAVTTLLSTASMAAAAIRRTHPDFSLGVTPSDRPHHIVDTLADRLVALPEARQELLETLDLPERVHALTGHLAELLGRLEAREKPGRGTLQ